MRVPLPPGADVRRGQRRLRRLQDVRHAGEGAERQRRGVGAGGRGGVRGRARRLRYSCAGNELTNR